MGICIKITFVLSAVVIAFLYQSYHKYSKPLPVPELDLKKYWGPGKPVERDLTDILPFKITFSEAEHKKLIEKLSDTSLLIPPLEDAKFHYGFNSNKLKEVISYWKNDYLGKWYTERETFLNQFPQFKTQIQGLNIHFIHVKPKVANVKVIPILLLHGWPGSVREFYEVIPLLTEKSNNRDFVFEVIVPSLPGYGFSQGASKQGLNPDEIAIIFRNLMLRLGKEKFYIQGGDWGSFIGMSMATFFPENVIGYHSNMCALMTPMGMIKNFIAEKFPSYFVKPEHQDFFFPKLPRLIDMVLKEGGYMHIQATKPDTIGTALSHNPIGLAAYILEKFSTWANPEHTDFEDGKLTKYFSLDALLDNLMFYYIPNSITTSQRLYKEGLGSEKSIDSDRIPTEVPTGCARFRYELFQTIDWVLEDKFKNLIHTSYFEDGGHFAALQFPQIMADDVVEFVKKVEKFGIKV